MLFSCSLKKKKKVSRMNGWIVKMRWLMFPIWFLVYLKNYAVMWGCRVLADSLTLMWNEDAQILKNLLKGYDMTIKFDCVKGSFIDSILFNGLANESNHELC